MYRSKERRRVRARVVVRRLQGRVGRPTEGLMSRGKFALHHPHCARRPCRPCGAQGVLSSCLWPNACRARDKLRTRRPSNGHRGSCRSHRIGHQGSLFTPTYPRTLPSDSRTRAGIKPNRIRRGRSAPNSPNRRTPNS